MERKRNLTIKQKRFCEKYVELGNAMEAYRQSYNVGTMKYASINRCSMELLQNLLVTSYIAEIQEKAQKQFNHTLQDSLKLDFDIIQRYNDNMAVLSNPKATKKQVEVATRVLSFMRVTSINAAQERIAKKLGLYKDEKPIIDLGNKTRVVFEIPSNGR